MDAPRNRKLDLLAQELRLAGVDLRQFYPRWARKQINESAHKARTLGGARATLT